MGESESYQRLVDKLAAAESACGYSSPTHLPSLTVDDLITALRHEPRLLASVRLDADAIVLALETSDLNRAALRLALHLRQGIENAARDLLLVEVLDRSLIDSRKACA